MTALAGAYRLGDPVPARFEPGARQVEALERVEWPEVVKA